MKEGGKGREMKYIAVRALCTVSKMNKVHCVPHTIEEQAPKSAHKNMNLHKHMHKTFSSRMFGVCRSIV